MCHCAFLLEVGAHETQENWHWRKTYGQSKSSERVPIFPKWNYHEHHRDPSWTSDKDCQSDLLPPLLQLLVTMDFSAIGGCAVHWLSKQDVKICFQKHQDNSFCISNEIIHLNLNIECPSFIWVKHNCCGKIQGQSAFDFEFMQQEKLSFVFEGLLNSAIFPFLNPGCLRALLHKILLKCLWNLLTSTL